MAKNAPNLEINHHIQLLQNQAESILNLELTPKHLSQFSRYTHLLLDWNERINLTAITEPAEIMLKHFLDSLFFVQWIKKLSISEDLTIGDLGTGAGFPGIPIKILMPDRNVILIDALLKRVIFLNEVIEQLGLSSISACHARAEDVARDPLHREKFGIITARAVAELPVLLEYAIPLLEVGGFLFAAKGMEPESEIRSAKKALQLLHCRVEHLEKYRLGEGADYRSLIMIRKVGETPSKYPRQAGKPKKSPL